MFALFSGLVGIVYLVLIHLELVVTSLEYIFYNQLDYLLILPTLIKKQKLNPWFLTGFVDGEGCFRISIIESKKYKTGWVISPRFQISLHDKDIALLELIQTLLGVGKISKRGKDAIQFVVVSIKELEVIIDHFDKYPLITQKWSDYELFKQALKIIESKEHLTMEGLEKLIAIKASMNLGLSESLKAAFPNIKLVSRPLSVNKEIPDPNWVSGFTAAEGCFLINVYKSEKSRLGEAVKLKFKITQHSRDEQLLKRLISYLGCGNYYNSQSNLEWGDFIVSGFSDITELIIPFLDKYPILGIKSFDFHDFKKVAGLIQSKSHLTTMGLNEIKQIKLGMNRGRIA